MHATPTHGGRGSRAEWLETAGEDLYRSHAQNLPEKVYLRQRIFKLMEVRTKEFRACEFVKEKSCLLVGLGKVFDLAEQQGLPGRDEQMAKVKEGAEAVAELNIRDARCKVTVLSRGPGSGKSTAMVFIADNWEKITGRTRGKDGIQSGPIVCQWTYNSRMSSRISQQIWPGVTGEQAAVARCLHGTLSCMGCEPIKWDGFLQKLGDTRNQELLPKSLPGAVDLMIGLFGEGRDFLIMLTS